MFRIPAVRLLEARIARSTADGANAPSWMYWFCWASRAFEGRLGATHALEIPFVFDNLDRPGVDVFIGPGERPQDLARVMHDAWIRFIRDNDPGWARYDLERRFTMKFDTASELVMDPQGDEREAWAGVR
jgi:para-nitrobenzyl esterase